MIDLLKKKKNEPTDIQLVSRASAWLGISEFEFFADAWQAWYDEKPSGKRLEPYFVNFLKHGAVPFWLRNYARGILDRDDLRAMERKRLLIGALTYYLPLTVFFAIIIWSFYL